MGTKVKIPKMGNNLSSTLCLGWYFTINSCVIDRGRIIVGWLAESFTLEILLVTAEVFHYKVDHVGPMGRMIEVKGRLSGEI